MQRRSISHEPE